MCLLGNPNLSSPRLHQKLWGCLHKHFQAERIHTKTFPFTINRIFSNLYEIQGAHVHLFLLFNSELDYMGPITIYIPLQTLSHIFLPNSLVSLAQNL